MKIGEWDNLGRARGLVQRQLGELGAMEFAAHVTVNPDNGRLRIFVATDAGLLDYQSYGCGVVFGDQIPPNFCGGRVAMGVTLTTPLGQFPGILTVICVIGPNPPNSIISNGDRSEGATLSVPGVINFNHAAGGENIIIQTG